VGGEEIGEGLTDLKVRVRQPTVEHRVRMKDFRRWLDSQGKTPAECTRERKLMALAKGEKRGAVIRSGNCRVSLPGPRRAVAFVTLRFVQRKVVHFVGALVAQAVLIVA
jgi:hypothetical protein